MRILQGEYFIFILQLVSWKHMTTKGGILIMDSQWEAKCLVELHLPHS